MDRTTPGHDISAKERTRDVLTTENVGFKDLLLSQSVLTGLQKARFERPSPIQLKAIPYGRCGLDLIVQAKSGTGKTCVFTVIALEAISTESSSLQVIILAPTREIAIQIEDVVTAIGQDVHGIKVCAFIGGRPVADDKARARGCHVAVGSPGRILQLIQMDVLKCQNVRILVLDEADKLLEENFQAQINSIYSMLPSSKQMIAASATYPEELAKFVTRYMREPTFVRLNPSDMALLGVKQLYLRIPTPADKFFSPFELKIKAVVDLLTAYPFQQALIFSNYHSHAKNLSDACNSAGLPATYISGNLEQERRLEAMKMLKEFKCRVLISTDLTSRGIDASNVDLVINLDVPMDWETYMHRTGRAGRFGSHGAVISIILDGKEKDELFSIADTCSISILPIDLETGSVIADGNSTSEAVDAPMPKASQLNADRKTSAASATNCNLSKSATADKIGVSVVSDGPVFKAPQPLADSTVNIKSAPIYKPDSPPTTRTALANHEAQETVQEEQIPKIPSLPELMSHHHGDNGAEKFSYTFSNVLDNLLRYMETKEFKDFPKVECARENGSIASKNQDEKAGVLEMNKNQGNGTEKKPTNQNDNSGISLAGHSEHTQATQFSSIKIRTGATNVTISAAETLEVGKEVKNQAKCQSENTFTASDTTTYVETANPIAPVANTTRATKAKNQPKLESKRIDHQTAADTTSFTETTWTKPTAHMFTVINPKNQSKSQNGMNEKFITGSKKKAEYKSGARPKSITHKPAGGAGRDEPVINLLRDDRARSRTRSTSEEDASTSSESESGEEEDEEGKGRKDRHQGKKKKKDFEWPEFLLPRYSNTDSGQRQGVLDDMQYYAELYEEYQRKSRDAYQNWCRCWYAVYMPGK